MNKHILPVATSLAMLLSPSLARADEQTASRRREAAMQFHIRAQENSGLLVPMYVYPANIETNAVFKKLINLKLRYQTVPFWVIVNPGSGPGKQVDANYTMAIDKLLGAGCVVIGYVSTSYAKRPAADVQADIDLWQKFYPRVQGIFFDEMINENTEAALAKQLVFTKQARDAGYWPIVANPGTETPRRYFAGDAADVIVVHEGSKFPDDKKLKGDDSGRNADFPPFTRAVLVHSMADYEPVELAIIRRYARWVYITEDPYRPGDKSANNPWDTLSKHLEFMCEQLVQPPLPRGPGRGR